MWTETSPTPDFVARSISGIAVYLGPWRELRNAGHHAWARVTSLGPTAIQRLVRSRALSVTLGTLAPVGVLLVETAEHLRQAARTAQRMPWTHPETRSLPAEEC